jgi:IS5 family transposase
MEIAMRQITFACQPSFEKHARPSRREQFLQTTESVVPWSDLEALIEPYYPKADNGRFWFPVLVSKFGVHILQI